MKNGVSEETYGPGPTDRHEEDLRQALKKLLTCKKKEMDWRITEVVRAVNNIAVTR